MPHKLTDVYVPCAPGSLMRSHTLLEPGLFRLSRRDCELYSVQITCNGCARVRVMSGKFRDVWYQPSSFTGSFWLSGGLEEGLIVEISANRGDAVGFMINFREEDEQTH